MATQPWSILAPFVHPKKERADTIRTAGIGYIANKISQLITSKALLPMSKRKNMGRGVEGGGGGIVQSLFPAFMFSIIQACILSFFPLYSLQIFLLPFLFFLCLISFLRFVFPFLVRSYTGLQKFINKKLFAVKFTTLRRQKVNVRKIFFIFLPYCCLQYVLHWSFQIPPPNLRHNYPVMLLRMVKNQVVQFYR